MSPVGGEERGDLHSGAVDQRDLALPVQGRIDVLLPELLPNVIPRQGLEPVSLANDEVAQSLVLVLSQPLLGEARPRFAQTQFIAGKDLMGFQTLKCVFSYEEGEISELFDEFRVIPLAVHQDLRDAQEDSAIRRGAHGQPVVRLGRRRAVLRCDDDHLGAPFHRLDEKV